VHQRPGIAALGSDDLIRQPGKFSRVRRRPFLRAPLDGDAEIPAAMLKPPLTVVLLLEDKLDSQRRFALRKLKLERIESVPRSKRRLCSLVLPNARACSTHGFGRQEPFVRGALSHPPMQHQLSRNIAQQRYPAVLIGFHHNRRQMPLALDLKDALEGRFSGSDLGPEGGQERRHRTFGEGQIAFRHSLLQNPPRMASEPAANALAQM